MPVLPDDMKHLLNYDEKVIWVLHPNETVVLTDQRVIIRKSSGLGLKKSFVDYPYTNMVNIKLDGGMRKASVEILMRSGVQSVKISNLSKKDAYQLHRIVRENIVRGSGAPAAQQFPVVVQAQERPSPHHPKDGEVNCRKCGRKVSTDYSLCPFCGYALKVECPECGELIERKFKLCPYCGEDVSYLKEIDLEL